MPGKREPIPVQMPITLWDIMKLFNSARLALLIDGLDVYRHAVAQDKKQSPDGKLGEESRKYVVDLLREIEELCKDIGLETANNQLAQINSHLAWSSDVDLSSISADLRNAYDALMINFWKQNFIRVASDSVKYVNSDCLFGEPVKTAFPSAADDIREAGNCIAVECGTAAVFHLMRAVEWGLRSLCHNLGVLRILKKKTGKPKYVPIAWVEWDKMLDAVHDRVDTKILAMASGKRKQGAQECYYPLLRDVRGFKEAFRNHVMHTRAEYTPEDAKAVLDHVQRFMTLLATRVKE